ncbi:hypothetical protein GJ744_002621 [Endocarpon pusillum]|uniref:Uncharacterized protein n=1 Tax=Endocarpon pusillum TaxID=364733 RepID=A0A8H7AAH4_9EURO|nr:hypothetical protein GJ744_002621 [Endocarpon pusillum]
MVRCYLVVTPNPHTTETTTYHVKFGDGNGAAAYHRCNPDYGFSSNDLAPTSTLNVVTYNASSAARGPGKWLEWIHIKITGGMQVYANTEWHELQVKSSQNSGELRNRLRAMLDLFPQWNRWEELGSVDGPTSEFETLVDKTWWCDGGDETIARFIN